MSIHLVGGGWDPEWTGPILRPFVAEGEARAAGAGRVVPRIGVALVGDDETLAELGPRWTTALKGAASCEPVVTGVAEGDRFSSSLFTDVDALLVGGGLTPAYLDAFTPLVDEVRLLVADGLPYLGFSAGAAIAAERAVIGGWRVDGVPVVADDAGEDLDEVTVAAGLALVDLTIDVHAAQWGTLSRLIAATEAGLVPGGLAIDESTVLVVGDGMLRVDGRGSVWQVEDSGDGVLVRTLGGDG